MDGIDFPIFTDRAMIILAESASFVPRVINILADKALLVASGEGAIQVTDKHAEAAIDDTPQLARRLSIQRRWVKHVLTGVIAAEIAAVIALFVLHPGLNSWAKERLATVRTMLMPAAAKSDLTSATPALAKSQDR